MNNDLLVQFTRKNAYAVYEQYSYLPHFAAPVTREIWSVWRAYKALYVPGWADRRFPMKPTVRFDYRAL